jgi:hypothetical protein
MSLISDVILGSILLFGYSNTLVFNLPLYMIFSGNIIIDLIIAKLFELVDMDPVTRAVEEDTNEL